MENLDLQAFQAHKGNGTASVPETAERLKSVRETLLREYSRQHNNPWIVAYSGGKDSTLLLHLVWEVVLSLAPQERKRRVYIVGNDTLVESPLVIQHLKVSLDAIQTASEKAGLPFSIELTEPCIDQTFWVNVIGRGYIPPTRNFRWCTDRMKIHPTNRLLEKLVSRHRRAVLLIGVRKSESQSRRRNMEKHGASAESMNPHSTIKGCRIFSPLADMSDEDVWTILMQRKSPWGGSHRNLITLYRNAGGGECPLILSKDDAPSCGTTSPRFGCWTCTVVQKDKSLRGLIDSGHKDEEKLEALSEFRDWLINLREDDSKRMAVRRNGYAKNRSDGTLIRGPFTMETRTEIYRRLVRLEKAIGEQLISKSELDVINDIWTRDQIIESGRLAFIENLGMAEDKPQA